jgi:type VI secretion system (T6SS) phospholipase Tle1-like effector
MMPKRIILLSDGTGNSASKVWKSNVWRVFESLDLRGSDQVAFYDDGVGTSSFKPLAILGGVFGWGLKRNVLDIYKFLCANYEPDCEIFGFGFSRGAFTIRVVIGLVLSQGLVRGNTDAEFYEKAKMAYRAYRAEKFHTIWRLEWVLRKLRDLCLYALGVRYEKSDNQQVERIEFLGLWDTVAAYGLPIDEMSRGVSQWIWPLELPDRSFNPRIQRACHALSLDDERTTFHPVLWNEKDVPEEQLSQVWFAGVHSNVGGGYPDDSLAHIPLYWIMTEAQLRGLRFKTIPNKPTNPDPDMLAYAEWRRDKDGRLYDSRNGLGGYYRYGPRKIADLSHMRFSLRKGDFVHNNRPTIHETAIIRAQRGAHRYAPIGIPEAYDVLTDAGRLSQSGFESSARATERCQAQEQVWNDVWRRRVIYFVTVFASLYIAIYPLSRTIPRSGEFSTGLSLVSGALLALRQVLPDAASLWINAYARDPSHFLVLGSLVVLLIWLGVQLGKKINDRMEHVWRQTQPSPQGNFGILVRIVGAALVAYAIAHAHLPSYLKPSADVQDFLIAHITTPVDIILIATLVALCTPDWLVFHLRSWWVYRRSIRLLKLYVLPFGFAFSFLCLAVLFGSHLAFSVEEANGMVCKTSRNIARALADPKRRIADEGLGACVAAGIASCSEEGAPPTCSSRREVFCGDNQTAICEKMHRSDCNKKENCTFNFPICRIQNPSGPEGSQSYRAVAPATCPAACEVGPTGLARKVFDIRQACHGTGVWLEQGQKYLVTLTPPNPGDPDYHDTAWTDRDIVVSTRGMATSGLSFPQRLVEMLKWPLKRHLFVDPFKVVARVGNVGSDERVLEPDEDLRSNKLEVVITPKRSGELFLYVNESVWALPWFRDYFYEDNSGKAMIAVQRPRQSN